MQRERVKLALCTLLCALLITATALVTGAGPRARAESAKQASAPGLNWLRMPGAEECLTAAALAERVELRAGRVLFVPATQADLFVDGYVSRSARGYTVQLQISKRDGDVLGERKLEIEGERCDVIDEAVTLVIAVTLYPRSALVATGIPLDDATAASLQALFGDEPTDPDPSTLPSPPQTTAPKKPLQRAASRPGSGLPDTSKDNGIGVDVSLGAGVGELPALDAFVSLHLRAEPSKLWPIELNAQRWLVSTAVLRDGAGEVDFELLSAGLTACPWTVLTRDARLCVGAQFGLLTTTPRDLAVPAPEGRDPMFDLTLALVYRPRLVGPLHLRLALEAAVPLLQHTFQFEGRDGTPTRVFSTAPLAGRGEVGLGLTF